jgi:signal peptidase I
MPSVIDDRSRLKFSLAVKLLRSVGQARLAVSGGSMLPALWPGDILEIHHAASEDISQGDIVVFVRENRLLVHRVLRVNSGQDEVTVITRGDRSARVDAPVPANELLGRVQTIQRGQRNITPRMSLWTKLAASVLRRSELLTRLLLHLAMLRRNSVNRDLLTPETVQAS